jgi:hypothetical protein
VNGVVVDTSVWIDFFSGRSEPLLEDALRQGAVVLTPVVAAELVSGARRARDRAGLVDLLRDLVLHETPLEHWIRVGELRRRLRARGMSVSTPDAHVARCAIERDAPLLANDAVFPRIARWSPLHLGRS